MTFEEIQAEICKLETALRQHARDANVHMTITSGRPNIYMRSGYGEKAAKLFNGDDGRFVYGDNPREMLDAAWEVINTIPDPEVAARRDWHRKLANVIDQGHALALPDTVMEPLRQGSQAMSDNLLTYEGDK